MEIKLTRLPPGHAHGLPLFEPTAKPRARRGATSGNSQIGSRHTMVEHIHGVDSVNHESHLNGEMRRIRALWQAVLVQALEDSVLPDRRERNWMLEPVEKREAVGWLRGNDDLYTVLDLAGMRLGYARRFTEREAALLSRMGGARHRTRSHGVRGGADLVLEKHLP